MADTITAQNSISRTQNSADPQRITGVAVQEPVHPGDQYRTVLVGGTVGGQAGRLVGTERPAGETRDEAEAARSRRAENLELN